jgi:hypothetical protein
VESVSAGELCSAESIELTLETPYRPLGLTQSARPLKHRLEALVVNDDNGRPIGVLGQGCPGHVAHPTQLRSRCPKHVADGTANWRTGDDLHNGNSPTPQPPPRCGYPPPIRWRCSVCRVGRLVPLRTRQTSADSARVSPKVLERATKGRLVISALSYPQCHPRVYRHNARNRGAWGHGGRRGGPCAPFWDNRLRPSTNRQGRQTCWAACEPTRQERAASCFALAGHLGGRRLRCRRL